jgi:hypothetical protein
MTTLSFARTRSPLVELSGGRMMMSLAEATVTLLV